MKIAGNEVKDITRDTAQVGCTKVTRAEAEGLLAEMNKVPEEKFRIALKSKITDFVNFNIHNDDMGWASVLKTESGSWGVKGLGLCLRREYATKLRDFLSSQLETKGRFIVEYNGSHGWQRSGNLGIAGEFTTRTEAETAMRQYKSTSMEYRVRELS